MSRFLKKLKGISIRDVGHIFLFLLACIPAAVMKKTRKHMWLICEYGQEARDNAYWLYRYIREHYPKQDIVYAIDLLAEDAKRVQPLGETIAYGSFKHWIYYLAAEVNISSHKGGKPNAAVCYLLEVYGIIKNKRVFLQHGITKDLAEMFFYQNTRMRLFICGAKPEYEYIVENFGYPEDYVQYTGFARFDCLLEEIPQKRQILVAPTWRRWLYACTSNPYENTQAGIKESEYVVKWKELLYSTAVQAQLEKYDYSIVFFPHRNMASAFAGEADLPARVTIADWHDYDLQVLMRESMCMITDYSSTAMDFAYMGKPLLYYQFDYERFRREHFEEGYFSYEKDGFGPISHSFEQIYEQLEKMLAHNCKMQEQYGQRMEQFFELRDQNNCERIYRTIQGII